MLKDLRAQLKVLIMVNFNVLSSFSQEILVLLKDTVLRTMVMCAETTSMEEDLYGSILVRTMQEAGEMRKSQWLSRKS